LDENMALVSDFSRTKPRPDVELLKKEENELFDAFDFKYPLGFFAGCNSFVFRVTFKEYKAGLKAAKYSLLLNQFNLNLEKFIEGKLIFFYANWLKIQHNGKQNNNRHSSCH